MKQLALIASLGVALPGLAQTQPAAPAPTRVVITRVGSDTPPEQLADERTRVLTSQLGLSPEQATKVRAAELVRGQERQARLRQLEASHASGRIKPTAEDQAIEDRFEAQLKAVCTPAQYERYQTTHARFGRLSAQPDSVRRVSPALGQPK